MSRKGPILDELWHFLRPAFSQITLQRHNVTLPAARRPRYLSSASLNTVSRCPQKRYNSDFTRVQDEESERNARGTDISSDQLTMLREKRIAHMENVLRPRKTLATADVPIHLKSDKPQRLEARLMKIAKEKPRVPSALPVLRLLIRDHKVYPTVHHYRWFIQCNVDSDHGSTILVHRLLAELQDNGIMADSATLHAALQVAAVHPDYVLRQEVLRKLRDQWLPLSPEGWHYVVAGQIREHQFELALDNIANMERKDIPIEEWLHSLLIYYLCEFQEMDQVLQLMRSRLSQGHTMTDEFWTHVLNAATVARHHDLIQFIWSRVVESGQFHPAPRLYAQVLASTRDGGELTTSVLRLIAHNNITFQDEDYVHWCEAVLAANNLRSALRVLCEMQQAGFAVPRSSTKPILAHCLEKKLRPRDVWKILRGIKYAGFVIPLACARVVIELCEKTAADDPFQVDDGISFYKELHMICPERPDTDIYNALISMCRVAQNTDSAMFVVQEMSAFGVLPDAITFAHLVLMCLDYGNFESSYFYTEDMHEQGFAFSQEARIEIRNRCAGSSDEYAVKLKNLSGVSEDLPEPTKPKHLPINEASLSPKEWTELATKREYNKERRKRKRRLLAIAQSQQDDNYLEYEPSLSTPKDLLADAEGGKK